MVICPGSSSLECGGLPGSLAQARHTLNQPPPCPTLTYARPMQPPPLGWPPTLRRARFERTAGLESLCESQHPDPVGCKPKIYSACKRGSWRGAETKEPRSESRKTGYGKVRERSDRGWRSQTSPRESWGGGLRRDPRLWPRGWGQRTLGTQLQVQHMQAGLNTRPWGQLCWNSRPPAQL